MTDPLYAHNRKLPPDDVLLPLFRQPHTPKELAHRFGVNVSSIFEARKRLLNAAAEARTPWEVEMSEIPEDIMDAARVLYLDLMTTCERWSDEDAAYDIPAIARAIMAGRERHAAEISRLNARIAELEGALKPFADEADAYDPPGYLDDTLFAWACSPTIGQLRRARAVLKGEQP